MRRYLVALVLFALASPAQVITTIVGNALSDNQAANSTTLVSPWGITVDNQGNIYVADAGNFVVRKVDPRTGRASIVAGGGFIIGAGFPLPGRMAALGEIRGLGTDSNGNLYFVENQRHQVRKLTPDGTLTTVAGTGNCAGPIVDNAPATNVDLCYPTAVVADRSGNLFISTVRAVVRVDAATNLLRRIAGPADDSRGFAGDGGPAVNAKFESVDSLAIDGQGNIYVGDTGNGRVRRIDEQGIIRTVAGGKPEGDLGDGGPATAAHLSCYGLVLDAAGNLLIADGDHGRVRRVDARTGTITSIAGGGPSSNLRAENIPALSAAFGFAVALAVDFSGNVYISDRRAGLVRRLDTTANLISTAIGTNEVGDGGLARDAPLGEPQRLALDSSGNLYLADSLQNRIRKVDVVTGRISTVAGTGDYGLSGDGGPARAATLAGPLGVFVNAANEIFIADSENNRIRKVDRAGIITTVAGGGSGPTIGDGGPATAAQLSYPQAVVANAAGVLFIADRNNSRVRAVDASGTITTVAGTGAQGFSGDGGPATAAMLSRPAGLALDSSGNLLVSDDETQTVRLVNLTSRTISTVAGIGNDCGLSGNGGPATQARLCGPVALAVDSQGGVYVADAYVNSVRRFTVGGTMSVVAGIGDAGFQGDGNLATLALLNGPGGVAVDAARNVYIADTRNSRVRKVTLAVQPSPALSVTPTSLALNVPAGTQPTPRSLAITNLNAGSMSWSAAATTSSGGNWLSILPLSGTASPSSTVTVAVNTSGLAAGTYQGSITVTVAGAIGSPSTVPVTLTLGENAVAKPGVSAQFLRFLVIQGAATPPGQALAITSSSSGTLNWAASATTSDGGAWLSLSPASGIAPSTLAVGVVPTGLTPGVYLGLISVRNTASSEVFPVAVSLVVSAPASSLLPSQTSFVFNAVQGPTRLAPQTLSIFNAGQGTMSWNIQTSIPAGGSWLTVTPTSGSSAAGALTVTAVSISVNPTGLAPGVYGAVLVIASPGASNSPALVTVLLNVQRAGTAPAPVVEPAGLVFVAAGGSAAQQQTVSLSSTGGTAMPFTVTARTADGLAWLGASPASGQVAASGESVSLIITANPGQLPAGVRQGTISITPQGGKALDVSVTLVVTPGAGPTGKEPQVALACAPTRQVLTPVGRLTNNFSLPAGWPAPLFMRITDDCGAEVDKATVVAGFSTEATTVVLTNLRNGQYSGSWTPRSAAPAVAVNLKALAPPLPEANLRLEGTLRTEVAIPVVPANAAVNGASFAKLTADGPPAPLTPGSIFSLFGSNFAAGTGGAVALPLPRMLLDAQVKIGGLDAPLFYVSPGQINAQVPWELAGRSTASIAVSSRGVLSGTETITLASVQPGIFSTASSGAGQGAILDAANRLVDSSSPVRAGDVIQIFATGLGPTTPTAGTGEAAPSSPPAVANTPVRCRIGGLDAEVTFAGLAPGFVGLYQVNAQIPAGIAAGDAVPVVLVAGGLSSNSVTIAVR